MENTIMRFNSSEANDQITTDDSKKFVAVPYHPHTFTRLKKVVESVNLKLVGKTANSSSKIFTKLNDTVPKKFVSNVCYELVCDCSKQYIGQTGQYLSTRFKQHQTRDEDHSAMSAHIQQTNCNISFDNMKVICNEQNKKIRDMKEAILIRTNEDNINIQHSEFNFGHQYDNFLFNM